VDFIIKKLILLEKGIRLHIWDLTGNERFRSVTKSYYRGARGAVLVYAVNDAQSFESISTWAKELDLSTKESIFKILVGKIIA
jgi:GTPase SAR1 family protein